MNSAANSAGYCGYCGAHSAQPHPRCQAAAELEPPRYCRQCGRRMVVQIDPLSWRARCSQHGEQRG